MASKKDILSGGAERLFSRPTTPGQEAKEETPAKVKRETKGERTRREVRENIKPSAGKTGRPTRGIDRVWEGRTDYYTSIVFDKEQYLRVREIAWESRRSIKETVFLLLQKGIYKYEKDGKL